MSDVPTPRERARQETLVRIQDLALRQLADHGPAGLSLRAVARELGLVSSAVYRYYPSRDDLVTALVVAAYEDLGEALGAAAASDRRGPARRWRETCGELRRWARAQPHRWSLLYGTVIPGYRAPQDTVEPAARVVARFCSAGTGGGAVDIARPAAPLARQLADLRDALSLTPGPSGPIEDARMLLLLAAFTRMVGAITLELGGHLVGALEPADDWYAALVEVEADALGLVSRVG